MRSRATWLVTGLVLAVVSAFGAALWWPATVRICLVNQSGRPIRELRFGYASCELRADDLRAGELIACDVSARGQADGATLAFINSDMQSVAKQLTMYFAQGDYGTYHVLLKPNELYWGPQYLNGAFAAFRHAGVCDARTDTAGFTRIPY